MAMLHDLVLSNCQFSPRQTTYSSASATHLKKDYSFNQFVKNIFVPTANEHETKTQRNTRISDTPSHLYSFCNHFLPSLCHRLL
jgi:hypothetical protein